jgi:hypothetical protein
MYPDAPECQQSPAIEIHSDAPEEEEVDCEFCEPSPSPEPSDECPPCPCAVPVPVPEYKEPAPEHLEAAGADVNVNYNSAWDLSPSLSTVLLIVISMKMYFF